MRATDPSAESAFAPLDPVLQVVSADEVETIDPAAFTRDYVAGSRPLIVRGAVAHWPALTRWTDAYLRDAIGSCTLPVETSRDQFEGRVFRDVEEVQMPFGTFLDRMHTPQGRCDYFIGHWLRPELRPDVTDHPLLGAVGALSRRRMIMTRGGNRIAFHMDRYHNMIAQVAGTKRLILCDPVQARYLRPLDNPSNYTSLDVLSVVSEAFPDLGLATFVEAVLQPGDVLFVPTMWWHTVESLGRNILISSACPHRWPEVLSLVRRWLASPHHGLTEAQAQVVHAQLAASTARRDVVKLAHQRGLLELLRLLVNRTHLT